MDDELVPVWKKEDRQPLSYDELISEILRIVEVKYNQLNNKK